MEGRLDNTHVYTSQERKILNDTAREIGEIMEMSLPLEMKKEELDIFKEEFIKDWKVIQTHKEELFQLLQQMLSLDAAALHVVKGFLGISSSDSERKIDTSDLDKEESDKKQEILVPSESTKLISEEKCDTSTTKKKTHKRKSGTDWRNILKDIYKNGGISTDIREKIMYYALIYTDEITDNVSDNVSDKLRILIYNSLGYKIIYDKITENESYIYIQQFMEKDLITWEQANTLLLLWAEKNNNPLKTHMLLYNAIFYDAEGKSYTGLAYKEKYDDIRSVDMGFFQIHTLPDELYVMKNIEHLIIRESNEFLKLPEEIAQLKNLKKISLLYNEDLKNMDILKEMNLEEIVWKSTRAKLPKVIYAINSIRTLDVSDNANIGIDIQDLMKLENLRELIIHKDAKLDSGEEAMSQELKEAIQQFKERVHIVKKSGKEESNIEITVESTSLS